MRIAFNRRQKNPELGPYIFLERLIKWLERQKGISIVRANKYHDLHFITIQGSARRAQQYKAKKVLRIDGLYYDLSKDPKRQNTGLIHTYHDADAVVFQCDFARQMLYKHFGKPKKARCETIIYNGVGNRFSQSGDKVEYSHPYNVICSARWHPQKRLSSIIKGFSALNRDDVGLIVLGKCEQSLQVANVSYLGHIPPHRLPAYYRGADLMIHLAYVDWCPNSVIEAHACGLPVITTHNGGVPELVMGSGVVIREDFDYDMEFIDCTKLPQVDPQAVASAINLVLEDPSKWWAEQSQLKMDYCGQQYIKLFKKVLA